MRRQRKLDQAEIPEDHVFITEELLGKGGFGEVYLADYNNHNAAAKVPTFLSDCHHGWVVPTSSSAAGHISQANGTIGRQPTWSPQTILHTSMRDRSS